MADPLKKSLEASQHVASLAVIVDALNQKVASFYRKYGFIPFIREPMKLHFPMKSIEELF